MISDTIRRNQATSFGLTLVAGLPFPSDTYSQLVALQARIEAVVPDRIVWYSGGQLHLTLATPLRGRYREWPPLSEEDLPVSGAAFLDSLGAILSGLEPFVCSLARPSITEHGIVVLGVDDNGLNIRGLVASAWQHHRGFDLPKSSQLHITLGYFRDSDGLPNEIRRRELNKMLIETEYTAGDRLSVSSVKLVHYSNRTLSSIVGVLAFNVGHRTALPDNAVSELFRREVRLRRSGDIR